MYSVNLFLYIYQIGWEEKKKTLSKDLSCHIGHHFLSVLFPPTAPLTIPKGMGRWEDRIWLTYQDKFKAGWILQGAKIAVSAEKDMESYTWVCYYQLPPGRGWKSAAGGTQEGVECSPSPRSAAAAAAKSLQSCLTLCHPIDGSPRGSPVPGILQARTLEWVAISFSNAWKWKVRGKSLSHVRLFETPWIAAHQAPPSMGFSRQEYWSGVFIFHISVCVCVCLISIFY